MYENETKSIKTIYDVSLCIECQILEGLEHAETSVTIISIYLILLSIFIRVLLVKSLGYPIFSKTVAS